MQKPHYVGAPEYFRLDQACRIVWEAFEDLGFGLFLVGSSLHRRDWRDIDVRCIFRDDAFSSMFPGANGEGDWNHPRWALTCSSIALHLSQATGLPVDFQIQSQTCANRAYATADGHMRSAIGVPRRFAPESTPCPSK